MLRHVGTIDNSNADPLRKQVEGEYTSLPCPEPSSESQTRLGLGVPGVGVWCRHPTLWDLRDLADLGLLGPSRGYICNTG